MRVTAEKRSQYFLVLNFSDMRECHGGLVCTNVIANTWEELVRETAVRLQEVELDKSSYKLYTRTVLEYSGDTYVSQSNYQDITDLHPKFLKAVAASPFSKR